VCNGDAALCERRYSNVTFIGAHNSYGDGQSIADNQNKDVTAQLVSTSSRSLASRILWDVGSCCAICCSSLRCARLCMRMSFN
jgi:hypothetical protein